MGLCAWGKGEGVLRSKRSLGWGVVRGGGADRKVRGSEGGGREEMLEGG